jgi:hypothetical protein
MANSVLIILLAFHLKHLLADFFFQNSYMLGKGKGGWDWVMPISAHCGVHVALSAIIIAWYAPSALWLIPLEFLAHLVIDRQKVLLGKLPSGTWSPETRGKNLSKYYMAFGIDQFAHQICYVLMTYVMWHF